MFRTFLFFFIALTLSCNDVDKSITAQQIVDKAILVSGGAHYTKSQTSFFFRDRKYVSSVKEGKTILKRFTFSDSLAIADIKEGSKFQRFFNDSLLKLPDSIENRYANAVNSVHYFAKLPYGLNDNAVNKELMGEVTIKGKQYYKLKVTFDENGGGDDFEDTYLYWFGKESFKPDYLAYDFHVNGGGIRFREAYNERYVNEIRFVDYRNYKADPKKDDLMDVDRLFEEGSLELLSKIELKDVEVKRAD